ncbi:MAG: hypothetical protein ABSB12_01090 [Candidatus Saccharimonadales bacterium]|jgi:hypothetical protein
MLKKMKNPLYLSIAGLIVIVVIVLVIVLIVRNNNSNSTTLSSSQQATAQQQINSNWQNFFAADTTLNGRENYLQNGSKFAQLLQQYFLGLQSQKSSATVNSVSFVNKTKANVVYTIDLNGQPVLDNQGGTALYLDNSWKVSDSTLCGLIKLASGTPTVCQGL